MPLTWIEHAQDMSRSCQGHGRTHEDSYGFLKTQNRTKTHQDTDIFVLQIAEQTFQICSYFPTKAASKIEPLCSQDMTGHMWSNRGFWDFIFLPLEQFFPQLVRNIMVTDYFFVYSYFFQCEEKNWEKFLGYGNNRK